jgi:ubiquinone/menaquinone biosynthesis C-methylase UbiE
MMSKFVDWIPTQPEFFDTFFELCPVTASDVVYDLGSGDGRLLFAALEKGAGRCVGIDIDPERIKAANEAAENRNINNRIKFIQTDVLDADLSEASVIFCYLYCSASSALRPKFEKELKVGTRIVMESFPIPGWKPDKETVTNDRHFYFYTIPFVKTDDYETAINAPVWDYYQWLQYRYFHY